MNYFQRLKKTTKRKALKRKNQLFNQKNTPNKGYFLFALAARQLVKSGFFELSLSFRIVASLRRIVFHCRKIIAQIANDDSTKSADDANEEEQKKDINEFACRMIIPLGIHGLILSLIAKMLKFISWQSMCG